MKKLLGTDLTGSYTFNPSAKTITFSGLGQSIDLQNILLITNTTANTIIYNFADSSSGAVSFSNNVLTLDYNTTSMASTDKLQIYVDVPAYEESLHDLLRRMNKLLESNAVVDNRLRQKVVIEAIGTNLAAPTEVNATVPVSGTVTATASGTYSVSVNNGVASQLVSNSAANPYTITSTTTGLIMEGPVHQLWRVANDAQACYASAIRSKLTFT
jgi:hypothetical protein